MAVDSDPGALQRLDLWLVHARFFKTRSQAASLCRGGRVRIDGRRVTKSAANVRPGAVLTFPWGDRVVVARVLALAARRGPADLARTLYEDLSPPAPPKAAFQPAPDGLRPKGAGAPTKKQRRQIARLKGL
ncbi:hypothetical protein CCR85_02675 [Rhodothalassium salexigens]|nr:hypothetical protein [Rhodothalassium salexigens]MBK5920860.1 hypothetical protein [Rhodothalassium salexigens]